MVKSKKIPTKGKESWKDYALKPRLLMRIFTGLSKNLASSGVCVRHNTYEEVAIY